MPLFEAGNREERQFLASSEGFDDGGDKLFHKAVMDKGGPAVVDEVDDQPFNVAAILVLKQEQF